MRTYGTCLNERAMYRTDLYRAAQRGGNVLVKFLNRTRDLYAPEEWGRVLKMLRNYGSERIAYFVDHKMRSYSPGATFDPAVKDDRQYPSIVEVIITPHLFLRHALFQSA